MLGEGNRPGGAPGLGLLLVAAVGAVPQGVSDGYGAVVGEVRPPESADLAVPHACVEGYLYRGAQGLRLRLYGEAQHSRALLAREGVNGRFHALGRLAEVAGGSSL